MRSGVQTSAVGTRTVDSAVTEQWAHWVFTWGSKGSEEKFETLFYVYPKQIEDDGHSVLCRVYKVKYNLIGVYLF